MCLKWNIVFNRINKYALNVKKKNLWKIFTTKIQNVNNVICKHGLKGYYENKYKKSNTQKTFTKKLEKNYYKNKLTDIKIIHRIT